MPAHARAAAGEGCQPTAADSWAVAAIETNHCNGSDRTVATVEFGHFYPSRSAINSAPFSQIKTHNRSNKWEISSSSAFWSGLSATQARSDFQREVGILQLEFRSNFQEILQNSFWKRAQKILQNSFWKRAQKILQNSFWKRAQKIQQIL